MISQKFFQFSTSISHSLLAVHLIPLHSSFLISPFPFAVPSSWQLGHHGCLRNPRGVACLHVRRGHHSTQRWALKYYCAANYHSLIHESLVDSKLFSFGCCSLSSVQSSVIGRGSCKYSNTQVN